MPKKANKQKHNTRVVLSVTGFLVVLVLGILYFSGALKKMVPSTKLGYQNVTFTDAILLCQAEARDEFASRLLQLVVDNHSSRFDGQELLYKVFMKANVKAAADKRASLYINCYVKSKSGRIDTFEIFEEQDAGKGKAIRRESETLFNWPR